MNRVVYLTSHFAVGGALRPQDLQEIAARGFKSILSNLPDGESSQYPTAATEARLAEAAGLGFRHVPAVKADVLSDRVVEGVSQALDELEGPVFAHCASGLRSAVAWAAAAARTQPADCVIAVLKKAGFELGALREELEEQHGRAHPPTLAPALDCNCDGPARTGA